jgi:hypothetical protein
MKQGQAFAGPCGFAERSTNRLKDAKTQLSAKRDCS